MTVNYITVWSQDTGVCLQSRRNNMLGYMNKCRFEYPIGHCYTCCSHSIFNYSCLSGVRWQFLWVYLITAIQSHVVIYLVNVCIIISVIQIKPRRMLSLQYWFQVVKWMIFMQLKVNIHVYRDNLSHGYIYLCKFHSIMNWSVAMTAQQVDKWTVMVPTHAYTCTMNVFAPVWDFCNSWSCEPPPHFLGCENKVFSLIKRINSSR